MEIQGSDSAENPRAFEVLASLAIVGIVLPAVAIVVYMLVSMFPVIFLGQREETMIGWGWITLPAAIVAAPAIAAAITYCLLKLVTPHAFAYLLFGAVGCFFILPQTPLVEWFMRGGKWLYELVK